MKNDKKILPVKWGIVGFTGLGLLFVGLLISLAQPVTGIIAKVLMLLGGAGIAAFLIFDFESVKSAFAGRQARAGLRTSAVLILVTAVLVMAYILLNGMNILRIDVTSNKRFTNSSMTQRVVAGVKEKVRFLLFTQKAPENAPPEAARMYMTMDGHVRGLEFMLKNYNRQNSLIRVEVVDIEERPLLAKKYGIRNPGSALIVAGKKSRMLRPEDYIKIRFVGRRPQQVVQYEEALTRALEALTRKRVFRIYFVQGHRELDVNKTDPVGASFARAALEEEGMSVMATNLLSGGKVPADCDLLVIAGGRDIIQQKELQAVEEYMMAGGPALFMVERDSSLSYKNFLSRWGVTVQSVTVMEPVNFIQYPFLFVPHYNPAHPVMKPILEDNARALFFTAAVLGKAPAAIKKDSPFMMEELVTTGKQAWAERDDLNDAKVMPTREPGEKTGPHPVAFAVTRRARKTEIVKGKRVVKEDGPLKRLRYIVVGDADIIGNNLFTRYPGNRMFLVNAVRWAMAQEKQISIPPRTFVYKPLQLTDGDLNLIFIIVVILMPLAIVVTGLTVYVRRWVNG